MNDRAVPDVEVRHLHVLVAIAGTGTLTGAAAMLGIGQPAVSRALAQLEERLGVRLVNRTTRSVRLTPAGHAFHEGAVRSLAALDAAVAAARGERQPLRLGFSWSAAGRHTFPLLRSWRELHPEIPLEVHRHDDVTAGLAGADVDVALVRSRLDESRYAHAELLRERRLVAVAEGDPLAGRASVRLADLAGRPLAVTTAYGTTTLALWPPGQEPVIVADARNIDDWLAVIGSGAAVGVTAASTADQHAVPGIRYVPLEDAPPIVAHLAWERRRDHPARAAFVRLARRVVRDDGADDHGRRP
jgi:DNA-binding transcriptional LysR family regulator